jgi:protein-L-isoaspartate(D-aspartate) O-methyltransferase
LGAEVIPDWSTERLHMVEAQLRKRGISDKRVLAAMAQVPREEFVPQEMRVLSYRDDPVLLDYGQTVSQPYMTALMAQLLELDGTETVLEVGAGSGYAAAVLGVLAARVIAVEIIPGLARRARQNLHRTGRDRNVEVIEGDGSLGYEAAAPYRAISVAAGAPDIPATLLRQLADPGWLVIPVGDRGDQELRVVTKERGRIDYRVATLCRFVPLRGGEGWQ